MSAPLPQTTDAQKLLASYYQKICEANIYDVAIVTRLRRARLLSKSTGYNVWLKSEDEQEVHSFKIRGAANKIMGLSEDEKKRGVITASAGNHAQGVAYTAERLGLKATIVMPMTTPRIKVDAVKSYGAAVILHGNAFPDALEYALKLQTERKMTFVHPYDDEAVIAGQGTIGREILEQHPKPIEAIFVPVGGGGLIAGIAAYVKFTHPEVKIIGVEPTDSDCLHQALCEDYRIVLPQVGLFADGVAVKQIGASPFLVARSYVDGTIRVDTDEIIAALGDIYSETRAFVEPAGALAVAGLKKYAEQLTGRDPADLVAIVSGANPDFDRIHYVAGRISASQKREMLMAVTLPERPGALREFCRQLNGHGITEFNYRHAGTDDAHIFVGIRVQNYESEHQGILGKMNAKGFPATDLTKDDMSKEHVRHMVGGRPPSALDETLYSFEFPERPGALLTFLESMPPEWNISLFHYRCHGASHGRVLMGFQVPEMERDSLKNFIKASGFNGKDETDNPAYTLFLDRTSLVTGKKTNEPSNYTFG